MTDVRLSSEAVKDLDHMIVSHGHDSGDRRRRTHPAEPLGHQHYRARPGFGSRKPLKITLHARMLARGTDIDRVIQRVITPMVAFVPVQPTGRQVQAEACDGPAAAAKLSRGLVAVTSESR